MPDTCLHLERTVFKLDGPFWVSVCQGCGFREVHATEPCSPHFWAFVQTAYMERLVYAHYRCTRCGLERLEQV